MRSPPRQGQRLGRGDLCLETATPSPWCRAPSFLPFRGGVTPGDSSRTDTTASATLGPHAPRPCGSPRRPSGQERGSPSRAPPCPAASASEAPQMSPQQTRPAWCRGRPRTDGMKHLGRMSPAAGGNREAAKRADVSRRLGGPESPPVPSVCGQSLPLDSSGPGRRGPQTRPAPLVPPSPSLLTPPRPGALSPNYTPNPSTWLPSTAAAGPGLQHRSPGLV